MAGLLLFPRAARAMGVWALAMMATWTTGCLVTDELEPRETPVVMNHPPRFVEGSIEPTNWAPIKWSGDVTCQPRLFEIRTVVDEDVTDVLRARWFVDFDKEAKDPMRVEGTLLNPDPPQAMRNGGDALRFTFNPYDFKLGVHVLKVLVSDGFAFSDSTGPLDLVAEGKGVASYAWALDTSACQTGGPQ